MVPLSSLWARQGRMDQSGRSAAARIVGRLLDGMRRMRQGARQRLYEGAMDGTVSTTGLSLSARLRVELRTCGFSARQLSRLSGVCLSQLYLFIRGERTINLRTADALARVLGMSLTTRAGANGHKL